MIKKIGGSKIKKIKFERKEAKKGNNIESIEQKDGDTSRGARKSV